MNDLPLRRLREFWDYLPAFRIVAETLHLPTAARQLALSPPALSRAIRLLEDSLGWPLFERRSRALHLTPRGQVLLHTVRTAMRSIDDATAGDAPQRPATVRATFAPPLSWLAGPWASVVARAGGQARQRPFAGDADALAGLLRGEVDLVLHASHRVLDGVATERLADATWRTYCGSRRAGAVSRSAPWRMATVPGDPWPASEARAVEVEVASWADLARVAADGDLVAMLPTPLARAAGLRLVGGPVARVPVFLSTRAPLPGADPDALARPLRLALARAATRG
jgi:DNA-binding transcriptional LysR family regulator